MALQSHHLLFFLLALAGMCLDVVIPAADLVPYAAVEAACGGEIRRWALLSSISPSGSDDFEGLMEGRWWRQQEDLSTYSLSGSVRNPGDAGTFQFASLQPLLLSRRQTAVANISGHFYLGTPDAHPIPSPLILDASGFLHTDSGEMCLACCRRVQYSHADIAPSGHNSAAVREGEASPADCQIRAVIRLQYPIVSVVDTPVSGRIEWLLEKSPLPAIVLSGVIVNMKGKEVVRAVLMSMDVLLELLELMAVAVQIRRTVTDPSAGRMVSVIGVALQGGALCHRWLAANWQPLIHSRSGIYLPLWQSKQWVAGMAGGAAVALSYWLLALAALRVKAAALRAMPLLWTLACAVPFYYLAWIVATWWYPSGPLEAFLELLLPLWLLPQVISNAATDVKPPGPLALAFVLGVTACRLLALAHTHLHPCLTDYTNLVQHLPTLPYFWPLALCLHVILAVAACLQQSYGGRFFLPYSVCHSSSPRSASYNRVQIQLAY